MLISSLGVFVVLIVFWYTLGKMKKGIDSGPRPMRFVISDLLWLLAAIGAALAIDRILAFQVGPLQSGVIVICVSMAWLIATMLLTTGGIERPLKRAVFFATFPATMSAAGIFAIVIHWCGNWVFGRDSISWRAAVCAAGAAMAVYGLRAVNDWVASPELYREDERVISFDDIIDREL